MADIVYAEILEPTVNVRFGKLAVGRIVPVDETLLNTWTSLGVAKATSVAAYEKAQEERASNAGGGERGSRLRELAAKKSAMWDVSTHRDAMTAPEESLTDTRDAGIPLVNLDKMKDDKGQPLAADASIDDIMDARVRLQERDPLRDHMQASTSGGGSHFYTPAPLNDPNLGGSPNIVDHAQEHPAAKRGRKARKPRDSD